MRLALRTNTFLRNLVFIIVGFLPGFFGSMVYGANHALLVGVGDYLSEAAPDLEGPLYDVRALEKVLPKWQVPKTNVTTLTDRGATGKAIREALSAYEHRLKRGDTLFFYFSGHGTSGYDPNIDVGVSRNTGALIPYDWNAESSEKAYETLLVGERDLKPLLTRITKKGVRVWATFDTCYSGFSVRSAGSQWQQGASRNAPFPAFSASQINVFGTPASTPPQKNHQRPFDPNKDFYDNLFYLASANEREVARDIDSRFNPIPNFDGKPHGAFTESLLYFLTHPAEGDRNGDQQLSYLELFHAIGGRMTTKGYQQTPSYLPSKGVKVLQWRDRPVFEQTTAATNETTALRDFAVYWPKVPTKIANSLREDVSVRWVDRAQGAHIAVTQSQGQWVFHKGTGDVIYRLNGDATAVKNYLKKRAWVERLYQRVYERQAFNAWLRLTHDKGTDTTLVAGDRFSIAANVEKASQLLVLAIDGANKVSVLYPIKPAEMKALSPEKDSELPFQIEVQPPYGTDYLLLVALPNDSTPTLRKLADQSFQVNSNGAFNQLAALLATDKDLAITGLTLITSPKPENGTASKAYEPINVTKG